MVVSEWLGGFGIDEGMLVPVISARDRWLKPGGVMIPRVVTAWAALVHDRYLEDMVDFLRDDPYGLSLDELVDKTVNEILYSGNHRHLTAGDRRSETGRLWTTEAEVIPLERAQAPHEGRDGAPCAPPRYCQRPCTLVQRRARNGHLPLRRTRRSTHSLGDDDSPAELACATHAGHGGPAPESRPPRPGRPGPGQVGRSRCPARDWEEHDEQAIWQEIVD